jgi:hypothetical protein
VKHVATIAPAAVPVMSALARWTAAELPSTGPFPLHFSHDRWAGRYRCQEIVPRGRSNSSLSMIVAMPDLFPVVRPWKEAAIHFAEAPAFGPQNLTRCTVNEASVARARARADAIPSRRDKTAVTRPWPVEAKPLWQSPVTVEPVDSVTQLEMASDSELNDGRFIDKKYVAKAMLGPTIPLRRRIASDLAVDIARWDGVHSQIKFDAGPFWLKHGKYFGLEERVQPHWRYIGRPHTDQTQVDTVAFTLDCQYTKPTENDLTVAFSRMLWRSADINKKADNSGFLSTEICDAKSKACRAYQAADLFRTYYLAGRRISTTDIICADLVVEAVQKHLRRDGKITWQARTAILDMLEGASARVVADKHGLHHSSVQDRYETEIIDIERVFGRYCQKYEPRQTRPVACYNGSKRRAARKPHLWQMSPAEREAEVATYLDKAKTAFNWLDDDFIKYVRPLGGSFRFIIKYVKRRSPLRETFQAIAEYLKDGGRILRVGAVYNGDAPYREDKRSGVQVLADRYGEPAGPEPFDLFDHPKPQRLRDDVEPAVDEQLAGTPFLNS